mmetsp:Transcript_1097/g.4166  ORF Transcript_1097/g.4166 Transcript_1097/m.4166 type:complete len:230 (-) Transcript_1097:275-964(-)
MASSMSDVTRCASAGCCSAFASFNAPCIDAVRCSPLAISAALAGLSALQDAWNNRKDALSHSAWTWRAASRAGPSLAFLSAQHDARATATRAFPATSSKSPELPSGRATGVDRGMGVSTGLGCTFGPAPLRHTTQYKPAPDRTSSATETATTQWCSLSCVLVSALLNTGANAPPKSGVRTDTAPSEEPNATAEHASSTKPSQVNVAPGATGSAPCARTAPFAETSYCTK